MWQQFLTQTKHFAPECVWFWFELPNSKFCFSLLLIVRHMVSISLYVGMGWHLLLNLSLARQIKILWRSILMQAHEFFAKSWFFIARICYILWTWNSSIFYLWIHECSIRKCIYCTNPGRGIYHLLFKLSNALAPQVNYTNLLPRFGFFLELKPWFQASHIFRLGACEQSHEPVVFVLSIFLYSHLL